MKRSLFLLLALFALPYIVHAQEFVPLTSIPAFDEVASSEGIADFLNSLYRLAVGAAAVLTVLQLVRAGIEYMGGDSITEKRHARDLVWKSLLGLVLVLSPAIVFGIIDPRILELEVDVKTLQPDKAVETGGTGNKNTGEKVSDENTDQLQVPGASGAIGGNYFYNIPSNAGWRMLLLTKTDTTQSPACLSLAYQAFSDEPTCRENVSAAEQSHSGWSTLSECTQVLRGYFQVKSPTPFCSAKEEMSLGNNP